MTQDTWTLVIRQCALLRTRAPDLDGQGALTSLDASSEFRSVAVSAIFRRFLRCHHVNLRLQSRRPPFATNFTLPRSQQASTNRLHLSSSCCHRTRLGLERRTVTLQSSIVKGTRTEHPGTRDSSLSSGSCTCILLKPASATLTIPLNHVNLAIRPSQMGCAIAADVGVPSNEVEQRCWPQ